MSDRPEDVDAAFAAIIADLEREGLGSDVEQTEEFTAPRVVIPIEDPDPTPTEPTSAWRGHDADWDWSWGSDDEHYVPPEPPPLPRLRPITILALVLVVAGVLLLVEPGVIGLTVAVGRPIALLALVCGFGLLFLRIRRTPPDDNGAQV